MLKFKNLLVTIIAVSAIIFTGCQNEPNPVEPENATQQGLSKFSIPDGATFVSATFNIHLWQWGGYGVREKDVNLHRITEPWEEMVVTYNSFDTSYVLSEIEGSFHAAAIGWYSADVTAIVGNWLDGTHPNYGLLLDGIPDAPRAVFNSRENTHGGHPYLEIEYVLNNVTVIEQIEPLGDATIYQQEPDVNYGDIPSLMVGWWGYSPYDKQAIVMFDIEPIVGGGCTRTADYWKNHTQYGPELRDSTWDLILPDGENSVFFLSEESYYEVLQRSPWGNAYFLLASEYIAAKLNVLSGASMPAEVHNAFAKATELLNTYTPVEVGSWSLLSDVSSLTYAIRRQFRKNAIILKNYNWGIIGPGRCSFD